MLEIIPAIDLIGGQCVRLVQGDYARKTVYHEDPVRLACEFEQAGVRRLHLVDLDGAKAGEPRHLHILEGIARHTSLVTDFGGGVRQVEDVRRILDAGAAQVTCGSIAVKNPDLFDFWVQTFGPEYFVLAADVQDGLIAVHGWQETSALRIEDFLRRWTGAGVLDILCTDISRDGMMGGAASALYQRLTTTFAGIKLIASGGIGSMDDIRALEPTGASAVVVGKAIYEGRISLSDIADYHRRQPMS